MTSVLGGLQPDAFLQTYWQKKPLVVRQAVPGFTGFVSVDDLFAFAAKDNVAARLVTVGKGGKRALRSGPFKRGVHSTLGAVPWTLLVQGLESLHDDGWPLLRRFDGVVPRARLDDLMVSYATEGAGVGPHTDRYDVFLLQGAGKRRWRLQSKGDLSLDDDADVPTVRRFVPEEEHVLEPGDMLYLPPGVAHDGTAVAGPCFTYSIGAIAPSIEGLLQNFLGFLSQRVDDTADLAAMADRRNGRTFRVIPPEHPVGGAPLEPPRRAAGTRSPGSGNIGPRRRTHGSENSSRVTGGAWARGGGNGFVDRPK
jgi:50S ribosomal protein L16 3-hydroxylase